MISNFSILRFNFETSRGGVISWTPGTKIKHQYSKLQLPCPQIEITVVKVLYSKLVSFNIHVVKEIPLKFLMKCSVVPNGRMFNSNATAIPAQQKSDLFLKTRGNAKLKVLFIISSICESFRGLFFRSYFAIFTITLILSTNFIVNPKFWQS